MEIKKKRKYTKLIPLAAVILMSLILFVVIKKSNVPLSVETILKYTPDNIIWAALVLVLLFALKSFTIIFPLSLLYLTSGILFSPILAILVSTTGLAVTISIPYWLGKYCGSEIIRDICVKYPKLSQIADYQNSNAFFACFITRIVGFLPGDIVSLYFGACKINFRIYLAAGICGSLLSIITTTLLGSKLNDPYSIEFILVLLCRILVSVSSIIIKYVINKQTHKNCQ